MIDPEKTKLMSQAAIYEHDEKENGLAVKKYFENKKGGIRIKAVLSGIAAYLLIAVVLYLIFGNGIIDFKENILVSIMLAAAAAAVGAAFVSVYYLLLMRMVKKRYKNTRSSLVRYDLIKNKLADYTK